MISYYQWRRIPKKAVEKFQNVEWPQPNFFLPKSDAMWLPSIIFEKLFGCRSDIDMNFGATAYYTK